MTELSNKQLKALPVLATLSNVENACQKAGISRDTFYRWNSLPEFRNELRRIRYQVSAEALDLLKIGSKMAAATLLELLNEKYPPAVRRSAANDILTYVKDTQESDKEALYNFKTGLSFDD